VNPTESFFLHELPAAIVRELPRFKGLYGTLAFSCGGKKYTVCLGNLEQPIVPGFLKTATVKLWFFGDAFDRFLQGELVSGKKNVMVQGDLAVLERFGRLLMPAASTLSVRYGARDPLADAETAA
jgi:hypothetical protein